MKGDWQTNLTRRTKEFALKIIRLYCSLPKTSLTQILGRQLLRSGTSPGAHYREALRARSKAEFISKLEGGLQELGETMYWLESLVESYQVEKENIDPLLSEADELIAMLTASVKTVKNKKNDDK